jgi:hypothetical protein
VPVIGLARVAELIGNVGQAAEHARDIPHRAQLGRVDAALTRALRHDDAGGSNGLQMLGRLRLRASVS